MASYRSRQPGRHLWHRFLQSARENLSWDASVSHLTWQEHGESLLRRLLSSLQLEDQTAQQLQCYKLAWEIPDEGLDLQKVHLVRMKKRKRKEGNSKEQFCLNSLQADVFANNQMQSEQLCALESQSEWQQRAAKIDAHEVRRIDIALRVGGVSISG
jgi:hypothetical protein